ncbi:DUF1425 domain-containing protein [Ruficoccus amylovorans]|uniref:DUF1425 domain-containing protein n=1 Tax=Ruficoccus amylovorans TaxID=1804625 RepID=A0A842HIG0_9BACT|nr:DUF1425 domain-containing protein [Ruficoccus amylovorans]MBC2595354.1 DUF1425 domain-containing protein [Ruficoccus amylovorans]
MKNLFGFSLLSLLAVFALSGCGTTNSNVDYKTQRIAYSDPAVQKEVKVELVDGDIKDKKVLQANIVNTTSKPVVVSYRVEWFNLNGLLINDPETKKLQIAPGDIGFVKAEQPDPLAVYPRIVLGK